MGNIMNRNQTSKKSNRYYLKIVNIVLIGISIFEIKCFEQPLFFRAAYFPGEPRFEKKTLTSFDLIISHGTATCSRNSFGKKSPLFDIYSPIFSDQLINTEKKINLAGYLSISGKFSDTQFILNGFQNFSHGLFIQYTIPFHITKSTIDHIYLSNFDNIDLLTIPAIKKGGNKLSNDHSLHLNTKIKKNGMGDTALWLGYTKNYYETEYLDFIDYTFKIGALLPTGKKRNEDIAFDIPLGNNGHYGIKLSSAVSIGAYEWLTTGGYISSTFFASHCINMYIKNNKTYLKINKKPLWEIGAYIKIDHTPDPISLIIGYSFNQKQKDKAINYSNISNDPRLEGWSMHTIQLMLEYDAAQEDKKTHPRISLVANIPIAGKRIFETTIYGLDAGVEMTWEF